MNTLRSRLTSFFNIAKAALLLLAGTAAAGAFSGCGSDEPPTVSAARFAKDVPFPSNLSHQEIKDIIISLADPRSPHNSDLKDGKGLPRLVGGKWKIQKMTENAITLHADFNRISVSSAMEIADGNVREVHKKMDEGEQVGTAVSKTVVQENQVTCTFVIGNGVIHHHFEGGRFPKIALKTIRATDKRLRALISNSSLRKLNTPNPQGK
ncbi:MAG: hypothetical protein LBR07_06885 [Puniceicoccales bacterium]|jgi:hypothetical protein|nr:hypothetical protein [Puniceicoccales bacterium]